MTAHVSHSTTTKNVRLTPTARMRIARPRASGRCQALPREAQRVEADARQILIALTAGIATGVFEQRGRTWG